MHPVAAPASPFALAFASFALALVGCAHAPEEEALAPRSPAVVVPQHTEESEVIAVDTPPPVEAPAASRPRLSRTITLGETQVEPITQAPPGAYAGPPNVVVYNNVVVQSPPVYYGGYGYGSYAYPPTYGMEGGYHPGAYAYRVPAWGGGTTNWAGAQRTAAPGQTPGVAGNWSAPRSYGPRPMR